MPRRRDPLLKEQPLPGLLGDIERVCGTETAERFARAFGGMEIYIPIIIAPEHPIARAVGARAARVIGEVFGRRGPKDNRGWVVPVGEVELRWNVSRRMALLGFSRNETVRRLRRYYGLTATVRQVSDDIRDLPRAKRAAAQAERRLPKCRAPAVLPRQLTLFEWDRLQRPD